MNGQIQLFDFDKIDDRKGHFRKRINRNGDHCDLVVADAPVCDHGKDHRAHKAEGERQQQEAREALRKLCLRRIVPAMPFHQQQCKPHDAENGIINTYGDKPP